MLRGVPAAQAADQRSMRELRRDIAILRDIRHTNLLSVIAFDQSAAAVVCEAIRGSTLQQLLDTRGPLDLTAAMVVYDDCLAGLQALHSAHVVHRDVRPDAILVETTGVVLLQDVGVPSPPGVAGAPPGMPQYLAPEVAAQGPSPAADVYAATAVFVEAVTGLVLHAVPAPGVSRQQRVRDAMVEASLPLLVQAFVLQALAEDPEVRRSDVIECRQQVEAAARHVAGGGWRKQGRTLLATAAAADANDPVPEAAARHDQPHGAALLPAPQSAPSPTAEDRRERGWALRGHNLSTWRILAIAAVAAAVFFVVASAVELLVSNQGSVPATPVPSATATGPLTPLSSGTLMSTSLVTGTPWAVTAASAGRVGEVRIDVTSSVFRLCALPKPSAHSNGGDATPG